MNDDETHTLFSQQGEKSPLNYLLYFLLFLFVFCMTYYKLSLATFVSWDDSEVLLKNKDVHAFALKSFFSKQYVGNYAPVTMLGFAIDWLLFKGNPLWHHLINLLFHLVNVFLVFKLAKILLKNKFKALLCALIFCFHPLQIETIAWVSAKNNLLYSLFFLSGLILYSKYLATSLKKYYVLTIVLFVLSLLSKPSAIVFPLCLFLFEYLENKEIKANIKGIVLRVLPFLVLSLVFGIITIFTRTEANFINQHHHFNVIEKIGNAGYALVFYISKFLLPINLSVIYPFPQNAWLSYIIGYIFIIALGFLIYKLIKAKNNLLIFSVLFFIANLLLVLQFIQFGEVLNADRYMYLPIVGLALCVAYFVNINSSSKHFFLTLLICLPLCFLSFKRTSVWQNSTNLYSDILKKYPHSYEALSSIGVEYMFQNDTLKARRNLTLAINEKPDYYKSHYNRGLLYARTSNPQKALDDFTNCIKLKKYTKAYTARAAVYYELKELDKAMADANKALMQDPLSANAHFVMANCYNDLNELDKALFHYNTAIRIEQNDANIFLKRAILFGKKQQFDACIADLDKSIYLNNNLAEAYYWRGVAQYNLNKNPCNDLNKAAKLGFEPANGAIKKYCQGKY